MTGNRTTLLVRPAPLVGESWGGYLLRLANANHVAGSRLLGRVINLSHIQLLRAYPPTVLGQFGIRSEIEIELESKKIGRQAQPFIHRYCPSCLEEDEIPFMRDHWEKRTVLYCEKHLCMLVTNCSKCKEKVTYKRNALLSCNCGFNFKEEKTSGLPYWLSRYYQAFEVERKDQDITFSQNRDEENRVFDVVSKTMNLVRSARNFRLRRVGQMAATKDKGRLTDLECLEQIFKNWPNGFKAIASNYLENKPMRFRKLCNVTFGLKGYEILRNQLVVLDQIKKNSIKMKRKSDVFWLTENKDDYVSKNYFKLKTGLNNNEILDLIQSEKLIGTIKNESTFKCLRYAIPKKYIEIYKNYTVQTSTAETAALEIGMSGYVIRSLVSRRVFSKLKITENSVAYRLDPVELASFAKKMTSGPIRKYEEGKNLITASVALAIYAHRNGTYAVPLLKSVFSGKIEKFSHTDSPIYIDEIYFELDAVTSIPTGMGRPPKAITPEHLYELECR